MRQVEMSGSYYKHMTLSKLIMVVVVGVVSSYHPILESPGFLRSGAKNVCEQS